MMETRVKILSRATHTHRGDKNSETTKLILNKKYSCSPSLIYFLVSSHQNDTSGINWLNITQEIPRHEGVTFGFN